MRQNKPGMGCKKDLQVAVRSNCRAWELSGYDPEKSHDWNDRRHTFWLSVPLSGDNDSGAIEILTDGNIIPTRSGVLYVNFIRVERLLDKAVVQGQ